MKLKTADDIRAILQLCIDANGMNETARDFDLYAMTIYRVLEGGDIPDSVLDALGLTRGYRNGRGAPITAEALRIRTVRRAFGHGGYDALAKALKVPGSALYYFATGRKPPKARIVEALGYETVYLPKKNDVK